jgi:anti-sigma factor RsiW
MAAVTDPAGIPPDPRPLTVECERRFDAAVYVLGALSADGRRSFESHLRGCAECRADLVWLAGLRALLGRVPARDVLPPVKDRGETDR